MKLAISGMAAVMALSLSSAVTAQSLGDLAKQEQARRKSVSKSGKVYTNETLKGAGDVGAVVAVPPTPAADTPKTAQTPKPPDETPDPKKQESYWRDRVAKAKEGLDRAKMFKDALQSRINGLSADFTARDDPAQRAAVAADRQKALAEFERVTKEIADFEKQLRDIEDEARKAGVPPGWVR
jgi:hypothetical protein